MRNLQTQNKPSKGANIRILLGEPDSGLRNAIRSALAREGFDRVNDFDKLKPLRDTIATGQPDLILLDSEMDQNAADDLITELRHNRLGKNPFVPVIVTIWEPTREVVQRVASSGTDDVLVKPISPAQVFERINALINNRKPFVVTSDYIGPDRRKNPRRGQQTPTISVPNTLRAKVRGERLSPSDVEAMILEAQREINDQRMKRNAFQVCFLVSLLLPELEAPVASDERLRILERLLAVARDTGDRMVGTPYEHVSQLCTTLIRVASAIQDKIANPARKDVNLMKPLSDAILVAFNPKESAADMAGQISAAVTNYKRRTAGE